MEKIVVSNELSCPVCGTSDNRHKMNIPPGNLKKNRYVDAIKKSYPLEFEEILSKFSLWECQGCGCIYWDPFFGLEARNILYSKKFNDHGAGWATLLRKSYLQKDHKDSIEASALISILSKYIDIQNYAEVNCPFLGLIPHITNIEKQPSKILENKLEDKSRGIFYIFYTRLIKLWIDHRFNKSIRKDSEIESEAFRNINLITIPTTNGWNLSCNRFSIGCNQLVNSLPLDYVIKKDMKFDLIGFFNTFDHLDDPLYSLNLALQQSKHILVQIHPWNNAGPQHAFYLPPSFWENLKKLVQNINVFDITNEVRIESGLDNIEDIYYLIERS